MEKANTFSIFLYLSLSNIYSTKSFKGHKTKCNKMEDDGKRLYTLIFNQL